MAAGVLKIPSFDTADTVAVVPVGNWELHGTAEAGTAQIIAHYISASVATTQAGRIMRTHGRLSLAQADKALASSITVSIPVVSARNVQPGVQRSRRGRVCERDEKQYTRTKTT